MRVLLELLIGLSVVFISVKYGWPWPIFLTLGYLIAIGLRISVLSQVFQASRRFVVFLGVFLTVALLSIWGSYELLLCDPVQRELIEPGKILTFLLGTDYLKAFWSVIIGFAIPMIGAAIILIPYGFVASQSMYSQYEQYRGHEGEATYAAIAGLLGINRGIWVVSNGKAEVHGGSSGSLARFGGPGILIVQEGHAVILERSGRLWRVVGRGLTWLEAFERISMVVPLQARIEKITVEQVATKDKIMIEEFEVLVFHKVDPGPEDDRTQDGQFAYNEDKLKKDVWSTGGGDPRSGVRSVSESAVRDVVGRFDLEQIVPMSDRFRTDFKNILKSTINKITLPVMGVEVTAVDLGKVKVPEEARKRLLDKWLADWNIRIAQSEREAMIRKGEAEAVILKIKEVAWAQAQRQVIEEITAGFSSIGASGKEAAYVIALRSLETLEKMAGDPATRILLPQDMLIQLRELRQVIGNTMLTLPQ